MNPWVILAAILLTAALGVLPRWNHMQDLDLGYFPSVLFAAMVAVVVLMIWTGKL